QIMDPADPGRMAKLDRRQQHPVQGDEYRDLHQDRQAATQRVDLFGFVHLHHLDLELLLVARVTLLQRLQLGRDHFHFRHRARTGVIERVEGALDDDRQQDDRPTPVVDNAVEPLQQPEQWRRDDGENAVVDDQIETFRQLRQYFLFLRTD